MVNMALDFANLEGYELQPKKSVAIHILVEFQLVYKRLGPDSSSVMTGFVLESFSGRVLVVQEVLRTVIIAPYRKAILVYAGFVDV
jgi:hypothetical protein